MNKEAVYQKGYIISPEYKIAYVMLKDAEVNDFFKYVDGEEPRVLETKRQKRLRLFKEQENLLLDQKNAENTMIEGSLESVEEKVDLNKNKQSKMDKTQNQTQQANVNINNKGYRNN